MLENLEIVKEEFGSQVAKTFIPKFIVNVEKTLENVQENLKKCFDEQYKLM